MRTWVLIDKAMGLWVSGMSGRASRYVYAQGPRAKGLEVRDMAKGRTHEWTIIRAETGAMSHQAKSTLYKGW